MQLSFLYQVAVRSSGMPRVSGVFAWRGFPLLQDQPRVSPIIREPFAGPEILAGPEALTGKQWPGSDGGLGECLKQFSCDRVETVLNTGAKPAISMARSRRDK